MHMHMLHIHAARLGLERRVLGLHSSDAMPQPCARRCGSTLLHGAALEGHLHA